MPSAPVFFSDTPRVPYVLRRGGGAVVHARLSIWQDVNTPAQKRVDVLFFEDALDGVETFSRDLDAGNYFCVLQVFIREDLNGVYDYEFSTAGQSVGVGEGDVNTGPTPGEGALFRHEFIVAVA